MSSTSETNAVSAVNRIYALMNDPTVKTDLLVQEYGSFLRLESRALSLREKVGEWPTFVNGKVYNMDDRPTISMTEFSPSPAYVKVYVDDSENPKLWGYSVTKKVSQPALLENRYPIMAGFSSCIEYEMEGMNSSIVAIVPYNESLITPEYQKVVDDYEEQRQAELFLEQFDLIRDKLDSDIDNWGEMCGRTDVFDPLLKELEKVLTESSKA